MMGLMFPKSQPRGRIDKSALPIGTPPRVEDEAFLRSAVGRACERCGKPGHTGEVVGAHVRTGLEGGTGYKPSDDLVVFLCSACHLLAKDAQERNPGPDWWFEMIFKPMLQRRYRIWKATHP
jgi:hypothetical protein